MAPQSVSRKDKKKGNTTKTMSSSNQIPPPFSKAPPKLQPFLDELSKDHAYIVHVDPFPTDFKRRIFLVPVALNVTIALLLCWRLYVAVPFYLDILLHMTGNVLDPSVDTTTHTTNQLVRVLAKRVLIFASDFVLFRFIGPWPLGFLLEPVLLWRWQIGFRPREICVRVSRGWGTEDLMRGVKTGEGSPFFQTRILPAIEKSYMRQKTAYLMMGKNWDLEFGLMAYAHQLVDDGYSDDGGDGKKKRLDLEDFRKTVLAFSEDHGWLTWQVWKLDEENADEDTRARIVAVKDKLSAMGKESLFFRWIEIVQYESSASGDFTRERQVATLKKVEKLFDDQGVDFRQLIASVGGMEGLPGMQDIVA